MECAKIDIEAHREELIVSKLQWQDVKFSVTKNKKTKEILRGVCGQVTGGEVRIFFIPRFWLSWVAQVLERLL